MTSGNEKTIPFESVTRVRNVLEYVWDYSHMSCSSSKLDFVTVTVSSFKTSTVTETKILQGFLRILRNYSYKTYWF